MKKWLKAVFSRKESEKPAKKREVVAHDAKTGMLQVMERVDKQIGRAVTRLSER